MVAQIQSATRAILEEQCLFKVLNADMAFKLTELCGLTSWRTKTHEAQDAQERSKVQNPTSDDIVTRAFRKRVQLSDRPCYLAQAIARLVRAVTFSWNR